MSQSDHSTWEKARTLPEQEFTTPWLLNQSIVECTERMQHPPEPLQTEPFLSWLYFQGVCDCQYLHYVSALLINFFSVQSKVTAWSNLFSFFLFFLLFFFIWQQRPPSLLPSPWEPSYLTLPHRQCPPLVLVP